LFTTRVRGVLPRSAEQVRVDEMDQSEAEQVLLAGLGGAPGGLGWVVGSHGTLANAAGASLTGPSEPT
jgi:hypothetical protein